MLEKVRSYRAAVSKVQSQLSELGAVVEQQSLMSTGTGGGASRLLSNDEIIRRHVEEGSNILDRTTQSILR
jgi:hypothetical protein